MKSDHAVQELEIQLSGQSGPIQLDSEKVKMVLKKVKSLEMALADALHIAYARKNKRIVA